MARPSKPRYEFELDSRSGTWVPKGTFRSAAASRPASGAPYATTTGELYLLVHTSQRMVKIGKTSKDATRRKQDYVRRQRLAGDWHLARQWAVTNATAAESAVHRALHMYRFSHRAREVFACSPIEATAVIERTIVAWVARW